MNFEEKLIRYITSKLVQRRYFLNKGEMPEPKKIIFLIQAVLDQLKKDHKQLKYVRLHSKNGFITPIIKEVVDKLKFK
jgi:hypothetical protein